jgi:hypothetical protein
LPVSGLQLEVDVFEGDGVIVSDILARDLAKDIVIPFQRGDNKAGRRLD